MCHVIDKRQATVNTPARGGRVPLLLSFSLAVGLAVSFANIANGQLPGGPGGFKDKEKVGVTLSQASGLKGTIYLKVVPQINPQGEHTGDKLEFYTTMNTQMKWLVRFNLPPGRDFKGLDIGAHTQGASVSPATADSWDGKTMIDKVTVKPWSMVRVLAQCEQQLRKPDGTYRQTAVFNLKPNSTERVRAKGSCLLPGAPSSNTESFTAFAYPKTRVTAYVLDVRSGRPGPVGIPQKFGNSGRPTGRRIPASTRQPTIPAQPPSTRPGRRPGRFPLLLPNPAVRRPAAGGRTTRDIPVRRTSTRTSAQPRAGAKTNRSAAGR